MIAQVTLAESDTRPRCLLACDRCQCNRCTFREGHDAFHGHFCPGCWVTVTEEIKREEEMEGRNWPDTQ